MNQLQTLLHDLRLSGLRETLTVRLQEALANRLTHEEFLTLALQDEVNIRQQRKIQRRVKTADFHRLKPLDEFDWRFNPSIPRKPIYELAACHFIRAKHDVLFIGPPGTGKTHLATGLGIAAAHHGHRVLFATATEWITRLTDAHRAGRLPAELTRLGRYGLIIVDEVGYLPFEQDAANLFFQLVSSRYEHASLVLTSNLPFSGWGGVFGDQAVAAAMIDRVVHHADVLTLKGASYRLRNRGIDTLPSIRTQNTAD
jgi:DNA replication protein DnaC